MDHKSVLRRAWKTTFGYPALLVFGLIVALTASGGGGGSGSQYTFTGQDFASGWDFETADLPVNVGAIVAPIVATLCCGGLLLAVVVVVARYVADTALVRMVDEHERTGETLGVREGFRKGWSRTALRFLGIDVLIGIPVIVASVLLLAPTLVPLLMWLTDSVAAGIVGTVASIGLFFLVIFVLIVAGAAISVLVQFARRACAIEQVGVLDAIRRGYGVIADNLRDAGLMWLIMVGVGLAWAIVLAVGMALLALLAVIVGGLPGLLVGALLSIVAEGAVPWIVAAIVALPAFLIFVGVPSLILGGFAEVFKSSVWTLTYRELRAQ
ncbi:MAG: hypothetical protein E3J64_09020 [Anaerolineales bacterium]|nr:MAG: hypothetical protein E3J64_09020 [Anaerolineales bacterium]